MLDEGDKAGCHEAAGAHWLPGPRHLAHLNDPAGRDDLDATAGPGSDDLEGLHALPGVDQCFDSVTLHGANDTPRRAKGGKMAELVLQPGTATTLLAYLERGRAALLPASHTVSDDPGWLFLSHAGGEPAPLTMNATSLMLTRRYHAGGGSLRCFGSHRIRHATATLLVNNGMPLEEVSRYLGHSSTVPTRRYGSADAGGAWLVSGRGWLLARAGLVAG